MQIGTKLIQRKTYTLDGLEVRRLVTEHIRATQNLSPSTLVTCDDFERGEEFDVVVEMEMRPEA